MNATERCGCGASITVEDPSSFSVRDILDAWRRDHQHPEPDEHPIETDGYSTTERYDGHPPIGFTAPGLEPAPLEDRA